MVKGSLTLSYQSINRSTKQSLVTLEVTLKRKSSSEAGRKMPTGVTVATGVKSWSAVLVGTRLLSPRAKGPTLTVALVSIESRNTCEASIRLLGALLHLGKDHRSRGVFLGLALGHFFRGISQLIELCLSLS